MTNPSPSYEIKNGVHSRRDTILGNQTVNNFADLAQVETFLAQILEVLRQPQATLRVTGQRRRGCIILRDEQGHETEIPPELSSALGVLQRQATPQQREEIYLARFTLDHLYAQWERTYLPLEGILHLEPSLRLSDASDQGISAAGTKIRDLRDAVIELEKSRLVILGEPGAGKTTTLERLALDLARERLRDPVQGKLPVRIDLFKFTDQRNPSDFLATEWQYTTGLAESYGEAIARGQVCFLLDGVNQMPIDDRNRRIEKWAHWANSRTDLPLGNWAIFTCRLADYTASLHLPEVHVQTLDQEHMRRYFELRFGPEQAARHWGDFERRLRSGDHRFERLARNPFMLSLLADNVAEGQGLTDNRARLMDRLAERLLRREITESEGRQPANLTADPLGTLNAMFKALNRLGFTMQAQRGEGTLLTQVEAERVKLFDKDDLQLTLEEVLHLALDSHVLEKATLERSGKMLEGYVFYHHLLQEYFAARRLLELFRGGQRLNKYLRPARKLRLPKKLQPGEQIALPPVTGWEETVMMAASLAGKDAPAFVNVVKPHSLALAGRCLAAAEPERADLKKLAKETRQQLQARQHQASLGLAERIEAGLALGELGHPALSPKQVECEGHAVWVIFPPLQKVSAGAFFFGSDPADPQTYDDEQTNQRQQTLPAFHVGCYSVTNAEYRYFIEAGGYQEAHWWSAEGLAWKQGGPEAHAAAMEDWLSRRKYYQSKDLPVNASTWGWLPSTLHYWQRMVKLSEADAHQQAQRQFERPFDRPAFWDDPDLSSPARPVVGINWHEAEAYCCWLSQVTGRVFRLPTELEWEKAARGSQGQVYPWGNTFDAQRCNSQESHILTTTPVDLFPEGKSPYGIFDSSGNIWEWTASWYQAYPGSEAVRDDFGERFRVVRGGSWSDDHSIVRSASRGWFVPDHFNDDIGFRLVSPTERPAGA